MWRNNYSAFQKKKFLAKEIFWSLQNFFPARPIFFSGQWIFFSGRSEAFQTLW